MNFFGNLVSIILLHMLKVVGFGLFVWFLTINADTVQAHRPMPAGSPVMVMQKCEAPIDMPTGVVLQEIGGNAGTEIVRNDKIVGKALDQELTLDTKVLLPGFRVLSFCK